MSFKGIGIRIFALILGVIAIIAGVYINFFQTKGFEKTTAIITSIEETEDAKTRRKTHDKDLAAGGSAIKKKHSNRSAYFSSDRRGSNPRSRPWQGRALPTTPLSHLSSPSSKDEGHSIEIFLSCQMFF